MKFRCIRECFVNNQLWKRDVVYDLPEDMESCEHFTPVRAAPAPAPEQTKPAKIPTGMYWCLKCKTLHRETSKTGIRHLKHKG